MALNKVELCGVNTAKLPTLTQEEKDALFIRIKAGDMEARELFIKGNLRLVLSVIRRFGASNENADDLFQIGCIGLIKSIDNFDSSLNVKFSTYAVPMILGEIRRYLRDNSAMRVSRSLRDTAYKAIYARENYMKKNLREPTIQEISSEIGIAKEDIKVGQWVHVHNIKTALGDLLTYEYEPTNPSVTETEHAYFDGFRRTDGKVGVRNEIWIVPTVGCVNSIAQALENV